MKSRVLKEYKKGSRGDPPCKRKEKELEAKLYYICKQFTKVYLHTKYELILWSGL